MCLVVKFLIDEPEFASQCAIANFHALGLATAHGVPAPEPIYLDETGEVLGVPGFVTRFVDGQQVAKPLDTREWAETLAEILLRIHAIKPGEDRRLLFDGHDEGLHFLREDWSKKKEGHPLSAGIFDAVRELQSAIVPGPSVLVHMDYWHGNVLWHENRVSAVLADIPHIKPEVSKEPTILYVDDCTDAPERCQTRYRAYWTTFWCGGWWSIGWESHLRYTMAPFQPLQTRTSPLVTPHHLR